HPDRLLHPLRRVGPKGAGRFERIDWDAALDTVADAFTPQAPQPGPAPGGPWVWCSATASTGCATRWATRATPPRSASRCPTPAGPPALGPSAAWTCARSTTPPTWL